MSTLPYYSIVKVKYVVEIVSSQMQRALQDETLREMRHHFILRLYTNTFHTCAVKI